MKLNCQSIIQYSVLSMQSVFAPRTTARLLDTNMKLKKLMLSCGMAP